MQKVQEWVSKSGKRIVRLHEREDHLFWFDETFEDFDSYAGVYWATGYQSGVFANAELAEAEIHSVIPWLRPLADGS